MGTLRLRWMFTASSSDARFDQRFAPRDDCVAVTVATAAEDSSMIGIMKHVIPLQSADAALVGEQLLLRTTPRTLSPEYEAHVAACTGCEEYNHTLKRPTCFSPERLVWSLRNAAWAVEDVRVAGTSIVLAKLPNEEQQAAVTLRTEVLDGNAEIEVIVRRGSRDTSEDEASAIFYASLVGVAYTTAAPK